MTQEDYTKPIRIPQGFITKKPENVIHLAYHLADASATDDDGNDYEVSVSSNGGSVSFDFGGNNDTWLVDMEELIKMVYSYARITRGKRHDK